MRMAATFFKSFTASKSESHILGPYFRGIKPHVILHTIVSSGQWCVESHLSGRLSSKPSQSTQKPSQSTQSIIVCAF